MSTIKVGDRVRITGAKLSSVPEFGPGTVHSVARVDRADPHYPVAIQFLILPGYPFWLEAGTFEVVAPSTLSATLRRLYADSATDGCEKLAEWKARQPSWEALEEPWPAEPEPEPARVVIPATREDMARALLNALIPISNTSELFWTMDADDLCVADMVQSWIDSAVAERDARIAALLAVVRQARDLLVPHLYEEPHRTVFWALLDAIKRAPEV